MFVSNICNNCNDEINSKNTYYKGSDLTFCSITCRIIKLNELKLNELRVNELKNQNLLNNSMKRNISYCSITIPKDINLPISQILTTSPIVNNKKIIKKKIHNNLDIFKISADNKIHNIVCNCLCFIGYIFTIYIINYNNLLSIISI